MPEPTDGTADEATPTSTEQIRAEIEQTRAELADTVDQLSDRLNVKAQAGRKADDLKHTIVEKGAQAKASAPQPVQQAMDKVGEKAGPVAHQVNDATRPHRIKILAGAVAALVVLVVVRRRQGAEQ